MAKPSSAPPLTPSPAALTRALAKAADRAQRLADAYRVTVPAESLRSEPHTPAPRKRKARS
ncbi:MAG TPA: hypothetical protein PKB14_07435 [Rubrivivax sp.]|nr:hypothetical protein [Rubrivivax sp.]